MDGKRALLPGEICVERCANSNLSTRPSRGSTEHAEVSRGHSSSCIRRRERRAEHKAKEVSL